jgi:hypothetical protein
VSINITQAAIEAGAARYRKIKYPEDGYTDFGVVKEIFDAMLPHLQPDFKVPVCSTCGRGKDDSPWCSNGFHFGGKPRPTMPVQATPAPSSLANDAGEGGLNSEDAEVERVARAGYESSYDQPSAVKWEGLTEYSKSLWLRIARAVIRAIREGQRWGIYMPKRNAWWGKTGGWSCSDLAATEGIFRCLAADYPNEHYELRPYTPARAKTPEQIRAEEIVLKHHCGHVEGLAESIHAALRDASKEKTNGK